MYNIKIYLRSTYARFEIESKIYEFFFTNICNGLFVVEGILQVEILAEQRQQSLTLYLKFLLTKLLFYLQQDAGIF